MTDILTNYLKNKNLVLFGSSDSDENIKAMAKWLCSKGETVEIRLFQLPSLQPFKYKNDSLGLEYTEDFLNKPKAELLTHIINDLLFYDEISNARCVFGEEIESIELYFEVYLENGENKSWSLPVNWDTPKLIHYFYQEIRAFVYSGEKTFTSLRIFKEKLMEFAVFSGLFDNVFIMCVSPESTGFCLETLDKQRRYRIQLSHKTIEECRNLDYFIASYINKIKEAYNIK